MKRNIDLNEISDGRLYSSGDMVKKRIVMTVRGVPHAAEEWVTRSN